MALRYYFYFVITALCGGNRCGEGGDAGLFMTKPDFLSEKSKLIGHQSKVTSLKRELTHHLFTKPP